MSIYCYIKNNLNDSNASFEASCYQLNGDLVGFIYFSINLKLWDYTIFNIIQQYSYSNSFEEAYKKFIKDLNCNGFEIISVDKALKLTNFI